MKVLSRSAARRFRSGAKQCSEARVCFAAGTYGAPLATVRRSAGVNDRDRRLRRKPEAELFLRLTQGEAHLLGEKDNLC